MEPSSTALVGREPQLKALIDAVARPPGVAFVRGEAGIGKSRLVAELLQRRELGSGRGLIGRCHAVREPFLLGPLVEALRGAGGEVAVAQLSPVAGVLHRLIPELAAVLPAEVGKVDDARAERHRIFRALRELITALGPVVLILEDVHWADVGTTEFLSFLLAEPPPRLTVVLTERTYEPNRRRGPRLVHLPAGVRRLVVELEPLSVPQVGELTTNLLALHDLPASFVAALHARTGGVPFIVEEVIGLVRDRHGAASGGRHLSVDDLDALAVPPAIRDAVLDRMDFVDDDSRRILRAAAVVEHPVATAELAGLAELPDGRGHDAVMRCLEAGLLHEQGVGRVGFRHSLMRRTVYEAMQGPDRARLHGRVAAALEARPPPLPLGRLAHHHRLAGCAPRWAHHAEAAADAATGVGDDQASARFLLEALQAPGSTPDARLRMVRKLGVAALFGDLPEPAIEVLRTTLSEHELVAGIRGELRFALARLCFHAGDASDWYELMVTAVEELANRPELAARALANLSLPRLMGGDVGVNRAWMDQALRTAAHQHDPWTSTAVHGVHAAMLLYVGDPVGWAMLDRVPGPDDVDTTAEQLELVRSHRHLAMAAWGLGHHDRATDFLDRAEWILDEIGHERWRSWVAATRLLVRHATGDWADLETHALVVLDTAESVPIVALHVRLVLAMLAMSRGETDAAELALRETMVAARRARLPHVMLTACGRLAQLHLGNGDLDTAREVIDVGIAAVTWKDAWVWAVEIAAVAVDISLAVDEREDARRFTAAFATGIETCDSPAARAALATCRGALAAADGCRDAALQWYRRAERGWAQQHNIHQVSLVTERRAHLLLDGGDQAGSEVLLTALAAFSDLGATGDVARVKRVVRDLGMALPYPWRGGHRSYGDELSPREIEVAGLAGGGLTNRQIAQRLFISPRTVEGHVAAAKRKAGVAARSDLAVPAPDPAATLRRATARTRVRPRKNP